MYVEYAPQTLNVCYIFTANWYHPHWVLGKIGYIHTYIPSMKLTWHLKMVVSNGNFQTSRGPPFSGAKMLVSGSVSFISISFAPKINWSTIEANHFQTTIFLGGPLSGGTTYIALVLDLSFPYHPWDWYIYLHEWLIFIVNVAKYTIHGCYGFNYNMKNTTSLFSCSSLVNDICFVKVAFIWRIQANVWKKQTCRCRWPKFHLYAIKSYYCWWKKCCCCCCCCCCTTRDVFKKDM